jgi:hypothetical protein
LLVGKVPPPVMLSEPTLDVYDYSVMGWRVIDTDTQQHIVDLGFKTHIDQNCRLYGIDGPENNTTAGKLVTRFVAAWYERMVGIAVKSLTMKHDDKYGGRYLGIVRGRTQPKGRFQELNSLLVREKLAKPDYFGGTKAPWTIDELAETEARARTMLSNLGITV